MRKILVLFIAFVGAINLLLAQDNCKDILVDGIRDTYITNTSYYNKMALMIDLSTMSYNEFKSKFDAGITIPVEGIPIKGSMGAEDFRKSQHKLKQRLEASSLTQYKSDIFVLAANNQIIYAWKDCMKRKEGFFQSIVSPIDIENGIYEYHYHWTLYPGAKPTFEGFVCDENLIVEDVDYFEEGTEIRPSAKTIVMLKLIDPTESASIIVKTSLGDRAFYIPGKKYIGPLVLTTESKRKLKKILTMNASPLTHKEWTNKSQAHCRVRADESLQPQSVSINETLTKLHYSFRCIRHNAAYNCGTPQWAEVGEDSYDSKVTADIEYVNGILYINNIEFNEFGKDSDCGDMLKRHLEAISGKPMSLKFENPIE